MQSANETEEEMRCRKANQFFHEGEIESLRQILDFEQIKDMPKALHNYAYLSYEENVFEEESESITIEKAIDILKGVIMAAPENSKSYALLGKIFYDCKKYEKALEMLNCAITHSINCSDLNYMGMIYYQQKKYDLSEHFFEKAVNIQEHPIILYNLALTFAADHKYEESMNYLSRVEICDDIWSFDLARIYFIIGKYKEAYEFYRKDWRTLTPNEVDYGAFLYSLKVLGKSEEYESIRKSTLDIVNDNMSELEDADAIKLDIILRSKMIEAEENIRRNLKPEISSEPFELQRCYLYYCLFHKDSDVF